MNKTFITPGLSKTAPIISSLAVLYYRHNDPARALAFGLAAMRLGLVTPQVVLLVAASFLKTGDAEQALAALSRFDNSAARFAEKPTGAQQSAAALLKAKALFRTGALTEARELLLSANKPSSEGA